MGALGEKMSFLGGQLDACIYNGEYINIGKVGWCYDLSPSNTKILYDPLGAIERSG
jgi:hypothetical protein